ncbi:MAG: PAS domain-containing protein, partial [Bryobacter sp.]|nr:PAS domain-containing protein [Bryobacter sp.]
MCRLRFFGCNLLVSLSLAAAIPPSGVLRSTREVMALTRKEAARGLPVDLTATVVYIHTERTGIVLHDRNFGLYIRNQAKTSIALGDRIRVRGTTDPGRYAPLVDHTTVERLGPGRMPAPERIPLSVLLEGTRPNRFIEVDAIVRNWRRIQSEFEAEFVVEGQVVYARLPETTWPSHIQRGARVHAHAACGSLFNPAGQFSGIVLLIPSAAYLELVAPPEPAESRSIAGLLVYEPNGRRPLRYRIEGTLTYQDPGAGVYIQDATGGIWVEPVAPPRLQIGQRVAAEGFAQPWRYSPKLAYAAITELPGSSVVVAQNTSAANEKLCLFDSRLVRMEGLVEAVFAASGGGLRVRMMEAGRRFTASIPEEIGADRLEFLETGSRVRVTGTLQCNRAYASREAVDSFGILVRGSRDIELLVRAPWWTEARMLRMLLTLAAVGLASAIVIAVLRRRVRMQTAEIRSRLKSERRLKDQYAQLFEQASDILLRLDLAGRVTAVNRAAAALLGEGPNCLGRPFAELLAEPDTAAPVLAPLSTDE